MVSSADIFPFPTGHVFFFFHLSSFSICAVSHSYIYLDFHDGFFLALARSDGSVFLASLNVIGLEWLVSSCVYEGVNQHVTAVAAATSH